MKYKVLSMPYLTQMVLEASCSLTSSPLQTFSSLSELLPGTNQLAAIEEVC
jgi:hypothetical protein